MNIHFNTNLDEARGNVFYLNSSWPFDHAPAKGSLVSFWFQKTGLGGKPMDFTWDLEVIAVSYNLKTRMVEIELHIPRHLGMNLLDWTKWIREFRGEA